MSPLVQEDEERGLADSLELVNRAVEDEVSEAVRGEADRLRAEIKSRIPQAKKNGRLLVPIWLSLGTSGGRSRLPREHGWYV